MTAGTSTIAITGPSTGLEYTATEQQQQQQQQQQQLGPIHISPLDEKQQQVSTLHSRSGSGSSSNSNSNKTRRRASCTVVSSSLSSSPLHHGEKLVDDYYRYPSQANDLKSPNTTKPTRRRQEEKSSASSVQSSSSVSSLSHLSPYRAAKNKTSFLRENVTSWSLMEVPTGDDNNNNNNNKSPLPAAQAKTTTTTTTTAPATPRSHHIPSLPLHRQQESPPSSLPRAPHDHRRQQQLLQQQQQYQQQNNNKMKIPSLHDSLSSPVKRSSSREAASPSGRRRQVTGDQSLSPGEFHRQQRREQLQQQLRQQQQRSTPNRSLSGPLIAGDCSALSQLQLQQLSPILHKQKLQQRKLSPQQQQQQQQQNPPSQHRRHRLQSSSASSVSSASACMSVGSLKKPSIPFRPDNGAGYNNNNNKNKEEDAILVKLGIYSPSSTTSYRNSPSQQQQRSCSLPKMRPTSAPAAQQQLLQSKCQFRPYHHHAFLPPPPLLNATVRLSVPTAMATVVMMEPEMEPQQPRPRRRSIHFEDEEKEEKMDSPRMHAQQQQPSPTQEQRSLSKSTNRNSPPRTMKAQIMVPSPRVASKKKTYATTTNESCLTATTATWCPGMPPLVVDRAPRRLSADLFSSSGGGGGSVCPVSPSPKQASNRVLQTTNNTMTSPTKSSQQQQQRCNGQSPGRSQRQGTSSRSSSTMRMNLSQPSPGRDGHRPTLPATTSTMALPCLPSLSSSSSSQSMSCQSPCRTQRSVVGGSAEERGVGPSGQKPQTGTNRNSTNVTATAQTESQERQNCSQRQRNSDVGRDLFTVTERAPASSSSSSSQAPVSPVRRRQSMAGPEIFVAPREYSSSTHHSREILQASSVLYPKSTGTGDMVRNDAAAAGAGSSSMSSHQSRTSMRSGGSRPLCSSLTSSVAQTESRRQGQSSYGQSVNGEEVAPGRERSSSTHPSCQSFADEPKRSSSNSSKNPSSKQQQQQQQQQQVPGTKTSQRQPPRRRNSVASCGGDIVAREGLGLAPTHHSHATTPRTTTSTGTHATVASFATDNKISDGNGPSSSVQNVPTTLPLSPRKKTCSTKTTIGGSMMRFDVTNAKEQFQKEKTVMASQQKQKQQQQDRVSELQSQPKQQEQQDHHVPVSPRKVGKKAGTPRRASCVAAIYTEPVVAVGPLPPVVGQQLQQEQGCARSVTPPPNVTHPERASIASPSSAMTAAATAETQKLPTKSKTTTAMISRKIKKIAHFVGKAPRRWSGSAAVAALPPSKDEAERSSLPPILSKQQQQHEPQQERQTQDPALTACPTEEVPVSNLVPPPPPRLDGVDPSASPEPTLLNRKEQMRFLGVACTISPRVPPCNHVMVNYEREKRGLAALRRSRYLDMLASTQAATIASIGEDNALSVILGEESKEQGAVVASKMANVRNELRSSVAEGKAVAENMLRGKDIRSIHEATMRELQGKDKRENILNPQFSEFGMGTAVGENDVLYMVQLFRET